MGTISDASVSEYQRLDALFRSWRPSPELVSKFSNHCKAAELYRLAGIIYLHRIIHPFTDTTTDDVIQEVLDQVFAVLVPVTQSSETPSVLCWAFVFIGPCVTDDHRRELLMKYLHSVYDASRMVNTGQTIRLLAKLWWVKDYEEDEYDDPIKAGSEGEERHGGRSRCSWDFHYVMRALRRWNTLIS